MGLAMPRYYFPATDGKRNVADDGGLILGSHEAARREARAIAAELLNAGDERAAEAWRGWRIQVLDASGDLISEIPLADVAQSH